MPRMSLSSMLDVLRQLENTNSANEKMEIVRHTGESDHNFKDMLFYALNPYLKFNTQSVVFTDAPRAVAEEDWNMLFESLQRILKKNLRGIALQAEMADTASWLKPSGRELYKRILLKDLRCGVGATLVNKVFPGLVPDFGCMLADPITESSIKKLKAGTRAWYQPKMNGDRMIAIIAPTKLRKTHPSKALSRKGHELLNYGSILRSLEFVVDQSDYKDSGAVFDGEVIMGDFYQTRSVKKLAGNEATTAVFNAFDLIDLRDWSLNKTAPFQLRLKQLKKLSASDSWMHFDNLKRVPSFDLALDILNMALLDKLRDNMVDNGFEGLIVRPDEPYNFKTRSSLYKHKKMDNADCMILEILEGDEGKKHEGRAGRILVEQADGTPCEAGLKLKDAERKEMWDNRSSYVGKVAEIQFQEYTKPKKGLAKMQFPVFLKVREDKS